MTGGKADNEDIPEVYSESGWSSLAQTPSHHYNHCQVNLEGRVYMIGGRGRSQTLELVHTEIRVCT